MALRIFANNSIGTGIRADLGTVDDASVAPGAVVGSIDNIAIVGLDSGHAITVDGAVFGALGAIELGRGNANTNNNTVQIGSSGDVQSFGESAIAMFSQNSFVQNRGSIFGDEIAIAMQATGSFFSSSKILNSGTIESLKTAIEASGSETIELRNSGTIKSQVVAFSADIDVTATVVNTGTITGGIFFGFKDDVYDGRGGRLLDTVNSSSRVDGRDGNDTILGGIDDDNLIGGVGNDTLDGGAGNDILFGDSGNDVIRGGDGDDRISGSSGTDQLFSGAGNDVFSVSDFDAVGADAFNGGTGTDRISFFSLVDSATLVLSKVTDVEIADIKGVGRLNVSSVAAPMTVLGSDSANALIGTLGFNDMIAGNAGNDQLVGRGGADKLTGGVGGDRFTYNVVGDSNLAGGRDIIVDFNRAQGDKIDLAPIDANAAASDNQAFAFIGTAAFSGKGGQLRYQQVGSDSLIYADVNGDKVADLTIISDAQVSFVAGDFIL